MNFPAVSSAQIQWMITAVAAHIADQRQKYAPAAVPLTSAQKRRLSGFFPAPVLDAVRIVQLNAGHSVENPAFYGDLKRLGFRAEMLPDFHDMAAVTFVDVVISHGVMSKRTQFHELVHVVQFRKIGLNTFAAHYVSGFLSGGGYDGIPLERNAYELEARFASDASRPFDVEAEVQSWIDAGRF